jgi:hypothetical protein
MEVCFSILRSHCNLLDSLTERVYSCVYLYNNVTWQKETEVHVAHPKVSLHKSTCTKAELLPQNQPTCPDHPTSHGWIPGQLNRMHKKSPVNTEPCGRIPKMTSDSHGTGALMISCESPGASCLGEIIESFEAAARLELAQLTFSSWACWYFTH